MAILHEFVSQEPPGDNPAEVDSQAWNKGHIVDADGIEMQVGTANPAVPAANRLKLWGRLLAGRGIPAFIDASGMTAFVQTFLGRNKIVWGSANGNGSWSITGIATSSFATVTGRNFSWDNLFKSTRRNGMTTAASANANANWRLTGIGLGMPGVAGLGGFTMVARFGTFAQPSDGRVFVGLHVAATSLGPNNPSALTNCLGFGYDPGDVNWCLFYNDGVGTATKVDLGPNFPCNTAEQDMYDFILFAAPGSRTVSYMVKRLGTSHEASGSINTNLPDASSFLNFHVNLNAGASGVAVGIDMVGFYIETDN